MLREKEKRTKEEQREKDKEEREVIAKARKAGLHIWGCMLINVQVIRTLIDSYVSNIDQSITQFLTSFRWQHHTQTYVRFTHTVAFGHASLFA